MQLLGWVYVMSLFFTLELLDSMPCCDVSREMEFPGQDKLWQYGLGQILLASNLWTKSTRLLFLVFLGGLAVCEYGLKYTLRSSLRLESEKGVSESYPQGLPEYICRLRVTAHR